MRALAEARRRGLRTVALLGYDGGRIREERLADHVLVVPSEHIPRIQEAQASVYHILRELVEMTPGGVSAWAEAWQGEPGAPLVVALALAVLLGLRHATDADHLTVVATLMVSDARHGARRAARLGLAWGVGHGVTLFAFGLPVVLLGRELPGRVHQVAEVAVGALIVLLALRLLQRWRLGYFHTHRHEHDGLTHAHPHFHESSEQPADSMGLRAHGGHGHEHAHPADLAVGRSPRAAFGVGLVHGVGGSAGAGILMIAAVSQHVEAMLALLALAGATALSMVVVSAGLGHLLARGHHSATYVERAVPLFGLVSLGAGMWFSLAALGLTGQ